ncbi:LytTR family DNA-binding domain-containing protein [Aureisphaera galaxeae]|uniref:LytR/AlgR family response regulator transcription factor n=1 Tax=Aureisphaera galaxeae TaxID=1538023 RepID=UPI0023507AE7|nr:LytTR family DNA-binding domain-containing protein [Aureisphaera galaxeae]MDC8003331.1 LytTR family DNA-binding domain-containing protein [Aureisphaera galaxeae]
MEYSCLVIEDNPKERERVAHVLQQHFPSITSVSFAFNAAEAKNMLALSTPDFILADIHLGDGLVFEILREFPQLTSKIIFTTSHSEYAIEAFQFSALSYLLKPYAEEELVVQIQRTLNILHQENYHKQLEVLLHNMEAQEKPKRIVLKNHDLIHVVEMDEILYAQADNNYTHFFCTDRKILVSKSLKTFEDQLAPFQFFRCHHSYLINLSKIKALHKSGDAVILKDNSSVPVASSKKKILYQLIG